MNADEKRMGKVLGSFKSMILEMGKGALGRLVLIVTAASAVVLILENGVARGAGDDAGNISFEKELATARARATAFREDKERRHEQELERNRFAGELGEQRRRNEALNEEARLSFVESRNARPSLEKEQERLEAEFEAKRLEEQKNNERVGLMLSRDRRLLEEALIRGGGLDPAEEYDAYSRKNPYTAKLKDNR